jgi:translation elongation factor P/translation initiation factor 5A
MPSANDLRKGMAIKYNGDVTVVLDMQHRTLAICAPSCKPRCAAKTRQVVQRRFASTESIEVVQMNTRRRLQL